MLISVIISTYNRPKALSLVLQALNFQTDKNFEVVIADDGSTSETRKLIAQMTVNCVYPIIHVYQEDLGFRLARIRNLAVTKATGEYLIFLDGDCIPRPNFIKNHRKLALKNTLVAGNRTLLSEDFSKEVELKKLDVWNYGLFKWIPLFFTRKINRIHSLINIPFNYFRALSKDWKKVRGCNFALYKDDYLKVNGSDSTFEGWGYEDSDLAIRLLNAGVSIKSGHFATGVLHLYHHENDRSQANKNLKRLHVAKKRKEYLAKDGINQL